MSLSSLWPRPQVILIPMPRPRDFCLVSGQNLGSSHLASYLLDRQACVNYWNKCQKKQKQLGIGLKKIGLTTVTGHRPQSEKSAEQGLMIAPFYPSLHFPIFALPWNILIPFPCLWSFLQTSCSKFCTFPQSPSNVPQKSAFSYETCAGHNKHVSYQLQYLWLNLFEAILSSSCSGHWSVSYKFLTSLLSCFACVNYVLFVRVCVRVFN